ncbi:hypothetical protein KIN20_020515 [Parelaphostrongylus tenuis]|uniref:Uncharacterized protein n=1 Tax=Parelaphostrongylus tenuis TaxID=148309 RepID=A0AAD5QTT1_PARTN|nr:hypothetical protein KIN20_010720 [Parelaphostrongylus tenuis]KAJ1361299.1 hypothetical protein KIN20_020515 [Parelaphostrongylus tenuis]
MDAYECFRAVIEMFCGGLTTVGTILVIENLPTKHRLWMSTVVTWASNYVLFALKAYVTGTWRLLGQACNVVTVVAVLLLAFRVLIYSVDVSNHPSKEVLQGAQNGMNPD